MKILFLPTQRLAIDVAPQHNRFSFATSAGASITHASKRDAVPRILRGEALEKGLGAARFIRTLKEPLLWVRTFRTVEELRLAMIDFRQTYNVHWLIERHGHRSPAQYRRDQMDTLPLAT